MLCKNESVMSEVFPCLISFYIFVNVCDEILPNTASPLYVCVYVYTAECTDWLCVCVFKICAQRCMCLSR